MMLGLVHARPYGTPGSPERAGPAGRPVRTGQAWASRHQTDGSGTVSARANGTARNCDPMA